MEREATRGREERKKRERESERLETFYYIRKKKRGGGMKKMNKRFQETLYKNSLVRSSLASPYDCHHYKNGTWLSANASVDAGTVTSTGF